MAQTKDKWITLGASAEGDGPWWYRTELPARALRARGHNVRVVTEAARESLGHFDGCVTFMCSRSWSPLMPISMLQMKQRGIRVVYELDDDIWTIPKWNTLNAWFTPEHVRGMENCMKASDEVVVSTSRLAELVVRFNPNVAVVPNAIPLDLVPPAVPRTKQGVRIYWGGSDTHADDLKVMVPAIRRVMELRKDVTAVFMNGLPPGIQAGPRVELHQWVHPSDLYWKMRELQIDIGLAPLAPHKFNEAKSSVKVLEYGALGLAILASDVGPYRCIKNGITGFKVKENRADLWQSMLMMLVESAALRATVGNGAQAWVAGQHTMAHAALGWERVLTQASPYPVMVDRTPVEADVEA